jgi:phosphoglycolate phosphatase
MVELKIKQSTIKTIIFDFDGTLAKLNIDFQKMRESIATLISSHGVANGQLRSNFGLEMIDEAFDIINQRSLPEARHFFDEASSMIENIETEAAYKGALFDDTKTLLTALQLKKISCGIITRNCAKAVKIVFPDIFSYCPVVICRDDVNKVKPHPEHIILALTKLGSSAENTLMIGDHPIDIKTGRNAGTLTCGVLTGRCTREEFMAAGADIVLANASDILHRIVRE